MNLLLAGRPVVLQPTLLGPVVDLQASQLAFVAEDANDISLKM